MASQKKGKNTAQSSLDYSEAIRELIKHENDLINHRLTWFITLQGLLFAALGFAWDKNDAQGLIAVFSCLGLLTSLSSGFSLWGGAIAIENLAKISTLHTVIGRKAHVMEKILYPWYSFPIFFAIAWLIILWLNEL